ncbi:hypothetical protein [Terrisporobacter glycolicus]|uniref:hypothetical protein n=1 Tax=Terrisporobacter glycolicus TaxID=36841 RepID=UPI003463FCE7
MKVEFFSIAFFEDFILFLHLLHSSSIKQIYQSKHLYSLLQLLTLSCNSLKVLGVGSRTGVPGSQLGVLL